MKYQFSKRLFGSQERPKEAAAAATKKMLSQSTLLDTTNKAIAAGGIPNYLVKNKHKSHRRRIPKARRIYKW
jgi:hypothetical protein